jgi:hypothetical protein
MLVGHGSLTANGTSTSNGILSTKTSTGNTAASEHERPNQIKMDAAFEFGLAKYLLITSSVENGWFLANRGYGVDEGLLDQPMAVYEGDGIGCGEPAGHLKRRTPGSFVFVRTFEHGSVTVDLQSGTGTINCHGAGH